jgi:maltooligosyltrehalose trehalohydrolase
MTKSTSPSRRLPVGAEVVADGVHFRVWAPKRQRVEVVVEGGPGFKGEAAAFELRPEASAGAAGYFSGTVVDASAGTRYRFRLDGGDSFPDPASRFQPEGPHGASQVVDPREFKWSDGEWPGVKIEGQVVYEMHVGTFTREGTWAAAMRELPELARLGVTVIEMMPIADFPGRFGWGYDGVNMFAPTRLYGEPDDLRRFVDHAHALRLGVILDVVYNHLGPDGNYLKQFSEDYFTDPHCTDWGEAINFDDDNAGPAREFFVSNAGYWVDEFHFDGLRLDATQNIYDDSPDHILAAVTRRIREAARGRAVIQIAENEPQETRLVRPLEKGGYGIDALWNDDYHHSAMVAMTGRNEAYYTDYLGAPQEFISAIKYGYLYQGQFYKWQKKRRGTPALHLKPASFVTFIQNHDQIANSGRGQRCHELTSPGRYKALTALTLLAPGTPMLFQGQEFAASSPFFYFADHNPELAKLVCQGRAEFLAQFRSLATAELQACLPDPAEPETFERSKLDLAEREKHAEIYALHRDLLRLRREDGVFSAQRPRSLDGATLGEEAFVLRFFGPQAEGVEEGADDRLLVVNLGRDLCLHPAPEPLLAPPAEMRWEVFWSSEDVNYGGTGTAQLDTPQGWRIPGHACVALKPRAATPEEAREFEEPEKEVGSRKSEVGS